MIDRVALKCAFINAHMTVREAAKALNISHTAFYRRLNGDTDFKLAEVATLTKVLSLTNAERDRIFFTI